VDNSRYLTCLASDYAVLRAAAALDLSAAVPSCPGWTVADLTRHVGAVYLHKVQAMQTGAEPDEWPPAGIDKEEPLALLDRAYAELVGEFSTRNPADPCGTWYTPDQTAGFWIRRMAQETVIHRIDAELGTGQPVSPVPDDLAIDGIDECLKVFVAFAVSDWAEYFTDILAHSPGRTFALRTDGAAWRIRTGPGEFTVEDGPGSETADVTVSGPPADLLRWVWNRESAGGPSGVAVEGAPEALDELRRCITTATQ
jgi:uncharacterized protein (TIGR03083 family)